MSDRGAEQQPVEGRPPGVTAATRGYVQALLAPDIGGVLAKLRPGQVVAFRGPSGAAYRYHVGSPESSLLGPAAHQTTLLQEDPTAMRNSLITAAAQLVLRTRYPGLGI